MTQYTAGVLVKQVKPTPRPCWQKLLLLVSVLLLLLLLLLLFVLDTTAITSFISSSPSSRMADSGPVELSSSLSGFTTDLYQVLCRGSPGQNVFFSPLSVMTALGMTLMGSRSGTRDQLATVLKLTHQNQEVQQAFADLIVKYKEVVPEYELRTANMMYTSNALTMQQEFADTMMGPFQATAKVVDFGAETEAVRQEINQAVEKETNQKIKELIPQGILNSLTCLVLVNAVYFKGMWAKTFEKSSTRDQPFYTSEESQVMVPMMHQTSEFKYSPRKDLGATVLGLDYKGSNLSMVIVLPDERMGLAEVEKKMTGVDLRQLASQGRKIKVEVSLPRFKLEYSQDLVSSLTELGAPDLFSSGESDLSGIGGAPGDLYVSNVLHKAFLEVNEEGSEAAAATAVMVQLKSARLPAPTPKFVADHPFLFWILDGATGTVLFMGKLLDPTEQ